MFVFATQIFLVMSIPSTKALKISTPRYISNIYKLKIHGKQSNNKYFLSKNRLTLNKVPIVYIT